MSDMTIAPPKPRTDGEYETAIDELFAEIDRSQARIFQHQSDTQRLKTETQLLRVESDLIEAQTLTRLESLELILAVS